MANKAIIAFAVIILGVFAGWYLFGGKGGIPTFPDSKRLTLTPKATPTAEPTGTYQFTEENAKATPEPNVTSVTKGGIEETKSAVSRITFTDTGFTPSVLTVKVGTAVTFVNQSKVSMYVISAIHPTHQVLSGLNEGKSVVNGGTYTYTFSKVGTWKYHNENKPDQTGAVIVTQ